LNNSHSKRFYEFGPFRLDVTERLLLCDGAMVALTPKAFDTLLILIENSGRLVEKEDLMKRLWPDTFVEEANLAHHVSVLRKTFEDCANGNKIYPDRAAPRLSFHRRREARARSKRGSNS